MIHPFLMIDGYNLMHAAGLARHNYGPGDLEVCRKRLLQQLSVRLNSVAARRTTVVFDAFGAHDDANRVQMSHGMSVVYAPAGTDADSEMERLIAAHSSPKQLLVISSDHRLHKAAQRRKAKAVDSEVFWESLDPASSSPSKPSSYQQQLTTTDRAKEFSNVEGVADSTDLTEDGVFDTDYLKDLESEIDE